MEQSLWNFPLLSCSEEGSERYPPLGEVPAVDVTQVVPVSVVGTQSLFRVPEISEVPSSDLGKAKRLPRRWFQGSFSSRLSLHFLEGQYMMLPSGAGEARCSLGPEHILVIFP